MNPIQLVNSATHIKGNTPYLVFFTQQRPHLKSDDQFLQFKPHGSLPYYI